MNCLNNFSNGIFADEKALAVLAKAKEASLLLISDTHGDFEALKNTLYRYGESIDALMFSGDGMQDFLRFALQAKAKDEYQKFIPPVFCLAAGNCDLKKYSLNISSSKDGSLPAELSFPEYIFLEVCSTKILLTHGHKFYVDFELNTLANFARQNNCTAAIYGHTHIHGINKIEGVMLINPGSLSKPRGNSKKGCAILKCKKSNCEVEFLQ